jgi:hypothetical protein
MFRGRRQYPGARRSQPANGKTEKQAFDVEAGAMRETEQSRQARARTDNSSVNPNGAVSALVGHATHSAVQDTGKTLAHMSHV